MADDERRAEIEAARDGLQRILDMPCPFDRESDGLADAQRIASETITELNRLDRARGARGDDAAPPIEEDAGYWRKMYEEAVHAADPPKIHQGVERILLDDGREFVLARSPQREDHEAAPKDRRLRGWWCSTCGTLTNHETAEHPRSS